MFNYSKRTFTGVVLALVVAGCGEPTTSVQGTVVLPDGVLVPDAAILTVHVSGIDGKRQVGYNIRIYKKKNPGFSPMEFVISRVPVSELKKYDRYHVYAQVDMEGDGRFTRGDYGGLTPITIQRPSEPIKDVRVELRQWKK